MPSNEVDPQHAIVVHFGQSGTSFLSSMFRAPTVGPGVTYNQSSGNLNVVSGTTANEEFLARLYEPFSGSQRFRYGLVASQRIANNNFVVMLGDLVGEGLPFECISSTLVIVTKPNHGFNVSHVGQSMMLGGINAAPASLPPGRYAINSIVDPNKIVFTVSGWTAGAAGTLSLFGWNFVRHLYTGTTATNVAFDAQGFGWATGDTTATINTTASPGVFVASELTGQDVWLSDALRASTTTPAYTTRASRYETFPSPSIDLYLWIWMYNGSTNPASPTTWTVSQVAVEAFDNLPVYLQGARAMGDVNPVPVRLSSSATVNVQTVGPGASGSAVSGNPLRIGGSDGTNTRNILTDATGLLITVDPIPTLVNDVASAALTTTTTTATITPTWGVSYEVNIPVTVVTGTTPTLDVAIEESDDTATNWYRVYEFPRISATGIYRSPKLCMTGNRLRYVQTVGGTTPSFTRAVNRLQSTDSPNLLRQRIDRTVVANTLNSTTPTVDVQRCTNVQMVVNMGAITTTATQFQIEGSDDFGTTWYAIGSPLTSVASSTVQVTVNNVQTANLRARVSTAGVGATLGWVLLKGF